MPSQSKITAVIAGSSTNLTPSPARERSNARRQSRSGTTSVTSGSSSTAPAASSAIARRHDAGLEAKPAVTVSSWKQIRSYGIVTSTPRRPICTIRPRRRAARRPSAIPGPAPLHSTTTSACASVPVSNPSSRASARRAPSRSVPRTVTRPPHARATCAAINPIAPGPITSTSSPGRTARGSSSELQTHASGSDRAAASSGSRSGTRCRLRAGSTNRGANPPSTCVPIERRCAHTLSLPARQYSHTPQVEKNVSTATRAPSHPSSTPSPSSATTPHTSCPIVTGGALSYSPSQMCRSVPQTPAADTSSATSPGPARPLGPLGEVDVPLARRQLGEPDHASSGRSVLRAIRKPRWTSSTEPSKRRSSCSIDTTLS